MEEEGGAIREIRGGPRQGIFPKRPQKGPKRLEGSQGLLRESARDVWGRGPQETTILDLSGLHEPWGTPLRAEGTVADLHVRLGRS